MFDVFFFWLRSYKTTQYSSVAHVEVKAYFQSTKSSGLLMSMTRRIVHPFRQHSIPHYHPLDNDWTHDVHFRAQQAALSREFSRFTMDNADEGQVTRRREQPDYTKKNFKRATEDLHSCLQEALEFFPRFETEFNHETKEIKRYSDEKLLNIIWEKKVQRFENGPRDTTASKPASKPNSPQQPHGGQRQQEESSNSTISEPSITTFQQKIRTTVQAVLECRYPEPIEDDNGLQIHIEEIRDYEERMRKTACRLYSTLGSIAYNVQAFRRVIRDMTTMLQDLKLYPLKLWKAEEDEPEFSDGGWVSS